jgi:sugar phosphate isomerase/epimerase
MLEGIDLKHTPISSIHEPCPSDIPVDLLKARDWMISASDEDSRRQGVNAIKRTIELAGTIGVKAVVVHSGNVHFDWPREKELYNLFKNGQAHTQQYNELKTCLVEERAVMVGSRLAAVQKSLSELIEYAESFRVCLGLENRYHYMDIPLPDEMELLLNLAGPDQLGFWYDVGHAQTLDRLGFYPHHQWLDRFADRIIGVHLHDAIGIDDHGALGSGEVDFDRIIHRIPPGAILTLEVRPSLSPEQIKNSLRFLVRQTSYPTDNFPG